MPATDAFASINVAGPRSRELLSRVTENVDLDPAAFAYLGARKGRVASVDGCLLLRLGFTGELSYQLHVPAGYGPTCGKRYLNADAISESRRSASRHNASCAWRRGIHRRTGHRRFDAGVQPRAWEIHKTRQT